MTTKQTPRSLYLPEHWTQEILSFNGREYLEIGAPDGHEKGFVTVDLDRRTYRHGRSVTCPPDSPRYAGRGWRDRLVGYAIAWLRKNTTGMRMIGCPEPGSESDWMKPGHDSAGHLRAMVKRLEAWAVELETDTLGTKGSGVGPFIAAELRNRMKGGS